MEGGNYKIQKSQVTSIPQGSKPKPSKTLLPPALSLLSQLCTRHPLCWVPSHQFGKLGSREAPALEGRQEADGHSSTLSWLRADGQQRLYVFQGNQFWEVTADGNVSEPRPLRERWAGLPPHIEAAAVSLEDGDFYFFKGTSPGQRRKLSGRGWKLTSMSRPQPPDLGSSGHWGPKRAWLCSRGCAAVYERCVLFYMGFSIVGKTGFLLTVFL